jgi:hypothetical protein
MANELQNTLSQLATTFAEQILNALREMSLDELLEPRGDNVKRRAGGQAKSAPPAGRAPHKAEGVTRGAARKAGRLARRSPDDIGKMVEQIVAVLKNEKAGLRAEQIRAVLKLAPNELPRPIDAALAAKRITKKGQKRATTYFAR